MSREALRTARWVLAAFIVNVVAAINGVFVRASGSGAGCGRTWPFCFNAVLPPTLHWTTLVEYGHRLISGLALLLVVYAYWRLRHHYPATHPARRAGLFSVVFIITEVLAGASLVIFDWVVYNLTWGRVIIMGVHLTNTHLLIAALALTAWFAYHPQAPWPRLPARLVSRWWLGLLAIWLTSVLGAETALNEVVDHWEQVGSMPPAYIGPAHFVRTVVWVHLAMAVLTTLYMTWTVLQFHMQEGASRPWARMVLLAAWLQLGLGALNWWVVRLNLTTQMLHLALAYAVWIGWWYVRAALGETSTVTADRVTAVAAEIPRP